MPIEVPLPLEDLLSLAGRLEAEKNYALADRLPLRALAVAPDQPDVLHLSGIVAFRLGRRDEALRKVERAIQLGTDIRLYLRNVSEVSRSLGRSDDALAAARRAAALAPRDPVCWHNLAVIQYHRLELDDCIASAEQALALNRFLPGPHFQLAEALLLRGEWERGWHEYQWRFNLPDSAALMPQTTQPRWDGSPFEDGTLLLIADQGFGDVIHFSRLRSMGGRALPEHRDRLLGGDEPIATAGVFTGPAAQQLACLPAFPCLPCHVRPAGAARHAA